MTVKTRLPTEGGEPERGPLAAHNSNVSAWIEKIAIADIHVVGRHRDLDPAMLRVIIKSLALVGLQNPITVRRVEKLRAEVNPTAIELVLGRYRFEAAKALGWDFIDAFVIGVDETEARIQQLIENLCRAELTALERAEAVTELVDLVRERDEAGQLAHPRGRQPHDRGISWASRILGFTREEMCRSNEDCQHFRRKRSRRPRNTASTNNQLRSSRSPLRMWLTDSSRKSRKSRSATS